MSFAETVRFIITVSTGIVRDRQMRRSALFVIVMAAMLMVFAGAILIEHWLAESAWRFLTFWGVCIWLTFTSILLAVHDMICIREEARRERQKLKANVLGFPDEDTAKKPDNHPDAP